MEVSACFSESVDKKLIEYIHLIREHYFSDEWWVTEHLRDLPLGVIIDEYFCMHRSDDRLNHVFSIAVTVCEDLHLPIDIYWINAITFSWMVATGSYEAAKYPIYLLMLAGNENLKPGANSIKIAAKNLGKRGGRPGNRHKRESLDLAKDKWKALPTAGIGSIITAVKHQLERRYKDAPSVSTLKSWLVNAEFRPKESRR